MGFLSDLFKARTVQNEKESQYYKAFEGLMRRFTAMFIPDNPKSYIDEGFKKNGDLYSVINYIVEKAAVVPFKLKRRTKDGFEYVDSHPLLELLKKPNKQQGGQELLSQFYGFKLTTGNSYLYAPRLEHGLNKGQTLLLRVLPAPIVEIVKGDFTTPVKGYKLLTDIGSEQSFAEDDVMHSKYWSPESDAHTSMYGMSPIKASLMTLTKSNENYKAAVETYQNAGIRGIISSDGREGWTVEQAEKLERKWNRKYFSGKTKGKIAMTGGAVKWQNIGLSPLDMNLVNDKFASLRDFCNIYKVSSALFNDPTNKTYNNMEAARKAAYTDAIMPLVNDFVSEMNRWLVSSYGDDLVLEADYSSIPELQKDMKDLSTWLKEAFWIKGKDKQRLMGVAEDDAMDLYFIPANYMTLEHMQGVSDDDLSKYLKGIKDYE